MTDGLAPAHLIDTNILLRISRQDDPDHAVVDRAVATLAASVISSENSEPSADAAISGRKHWETKRSAVN